MYEALHVHTEGKPLAGFGQISASPPPTSPSPASQTCNALQDKLDDFITEGGPIIMPLFLPDWETRRDREGRSWWEQSPPTTQRREGGCSAGAATH